MLKELSNPVPRILDVRLDKVSDPADAITEIVAKAPGYEWSRHGNAFLVVQKKLYKAPGNPMNQKIGAFQVPGDLSLFKLRFPSAVVNAQSHLSGEAIEGFGLPSQLSPPLKEETLKDMTARDILIKIANEVGNLYSDIILPSPDPSLKKRKPMFLAWDIAGGPGLSKYTVHSKSYPTNFARRAIRK